MAAEERWPLRDRLAVLSALSLTLFVAFKLFSLFLVPAHLVLGLFLCIHPLGILIGARYFRDPGTRPRALHASFLVLCLTVLGLALLRRVTPPLDPPWLSGGFPLLAIVRVVFACGLLLAPVALVSGVLEYMLLSSSRRVHESYAPGYAVLLGSAVLGLVIGYLFLGRVGALGLILLALGLAAAGVFRALGRMIGAVFVLGAFLCARSPEWDSRFVSAISPGGPHTARHQVEQGATLGRAVWDRHAYTQILETPDRTYGAYDNLVYWTVSPRDEPARGPDLLVYESLAKDARLAIIGVGGGAQVKDAIQLRSDIRVDAFEINQSVVDYFVTNPAANGGVFRHARVSPRAEEGRAGVRQGSYDAIYLPEAGTVLGYYRALALDLNFIHTEDAYREYLSRLRPGGVLAAAFAEWSDPERRMTRRLLSTLERLGLRARGFDDGHYRVVIATRPEDAALLARVSSTAERTGLLEFTADTRPLPSDDFGASQIVVYARRDSLLRSFASSAIAVSLLGLGFVWFFVRKSREEGRPWIRFAAAAGLGAGFVLLENSAILLLARTLLSLADAVIVGSVAFLAVALIGARFADVLTRERWRGLAIVGVAVLVHAASLFTRIPVVQFGGTLVLGLVSGALLPLLLGSRDPEQMPGLFACDSGGALVGVVFAFFVPLLYGMTAFGLGVAAVYLVLGALVVVLSKKDLSRVPRGAG